MRRSSCPCRRHDLQIPSQYLTDYLWFANWIKNVWLEIAISYNKWQCVWNGWYPWEKIISSLSFFVRIVTSIKKLYSFPQISTDTKFCFHILTECFIEFHLFYSTDLDLNVFRTVTIPILKNYGFNITQSYFFYTFTPSHSPCQQKPNFDLNSFSVTINSATSKTMNLTVIYL